MRDARYLGPIRSAFGGEELSAASMRNFTDSKASWLVCCPTHCEAQLSPK